MTNINFAVTSASAPQSKLPLSNDQLNLISDIGMIYERISPPFHYPTYICIYTAAFRDVLFTTVVHTLAGNVIINRFQCPLRPDARGVSIVTAARWQQTKNTHYRPMHVCKSCLVQDLNVHPETPSHLRSNSSSSSSRSLR